jgi:hypothetical protein
LKDINIALDDIDDLAWMKKPSFNIKIKKYNDNFANKKYWSTCNILPEWTSVLLKKTRNL